MRKYRLDVSRGDIYSPIVFTVEIDAYDLQDAIETAEKIGNGRYFKLTPITRPEAAQNTNQ